MGTWTWLTNKFGEDEQFWSDECNSKSDLQWFRLTESAVSLAEDVRNKELLESSDEIALAEWLAGILNLTDRLTAAWAALPITAPPAELPLEESAEGVGSAIKWGVIDSELRKARVWLLRAADKGTVPGRAAESGLRCWVGVVGNSRNILGRRLMWNVATFPIHSKLYLKLNSSTHGAFIIWKFDPIRQAKLCWISKKVKLWALVQYGESLDIQSGPGMFLEL